MFWNNTLKLFWEYTKFFPFFKIWSIVENKISYNSPSSNHLLEKLQCQTFNQVKNSPKLEKLNSKVKKFPNLNCMLRMPLSPIRNFMILNCQILLLFLWKVLISIEKCLGIGEYEKEHWNFYLYILRDTNLLRCHMAELLIGMILHFVTRQLFENMLEGKAIGGDGHYFPNSRSTTKAIRLYIRLV